MENNGSSLFFFLERSEEQMVRIIKEGNYKRITCETCGAILAYNEKDDVKKRTGGLIDGLTCYVSFIECPLCGHDICCGTSEYHIRKGEL